MENGQLIALAAVGALLLYAMNRQNSGTAGDDESDVITDGVDEVNNMITGWPASSGPYQDTISQAAQENGVPVQVLAWLLWKESRYNPRIIDGSITSSVGALGIAQFMPATARDELGSVQAALDPETAINGAARYLAKLYRSTGSWTRALAAYNWGVGNVNRKGLDAAPAETVNYYTDILARANATGGNFA
jgi:soluble lytic murein transglycosylase-like protein